MVPRSKDRPIGDPPDRGRMMRDESRRPIVLIVTVDYPASLRDLVDREAATDWMDQTP